MIKKLRIRITAVIMTGLTILVAAVITGIYIFMLHSETEETDRAADLAVNAVRMHSEKDPRPQAPDSPSPTEPASPASPSDPSRRSDPRAERGRSSSSRNWIIVVISSKGTADEAIFSSPYNRPENEDEILSSAENIASQNSDSGYITLSDVSYRYFIRRSAEKTRVVFIDRTNQTATMRRLLIVLVIVGICALFVLFPISIIVSGWIVRPISKAWNNQKEFFANASHELKTPLTVISANLDVILSEPEKSVAQQEKWFEYIKAEAAKMAKLINQMLYLSREDREEAKMLMTELDMSELTEGACLAQEAVAFEKGHALVTEIEPGIRCKGDRERLTQLVNILIDNAISHSTGKDDITVRLCHKKKTNILTVSNRGEYIPPEELSKLFDRFYRTDRSRTSATGGFGLGLSIAETIAKNHKGTLTASSDTDGLTTFTFAW